VQAMRAHKEEADVQMLACKTLWHLASHSAFSQNKIAKAGCAALCCVCVFVCVCARVNKLR